MAVAELTNTQLFLAIFIPILFNGGMITLLAMYTKSGSGLLSAPGEVFSSTKHTSTLVQQKRNSDW